MNKVWNKSYDSWTVDGVFDVDEIYINWKPNLILALMKSTKDNT